MPDGGNVYVTIKPKDDDHIIVSLTDEGIGMTEDKLKRLGEPFIRQRSGALDLG